MELTRIRLTILSILLVLAQRCSGTDVKETKINWERCTRSRSETICYIPLKCKVAGNTDRNMEDVKRISELAVTPNECDTGVQFKPMGKSKWLVYMQVQEAQLDLSKGVSLEGNAPLYGCRKNGAEIEYFGDSRLKIEKYSKAQQDAANDRIFCSFVISGNTETLSDILLKSDKGFFKFAASGPQNYDMGVTLRTIFDTVNGIRTCEPEDATFNAGDINPEFIRQKIEITEQKNNKCPKGNLYVKDATGEYIESSDVECVKEGTDYVFRYIVKKDQSPVPIAVGTPFDVHCATKACTLCENLISTGITDKGVAAAFVKGNEDAGECAVATCPVTGENWEYEDVDGNKDTRVTTVACKKKGDEASWFAEDGKEIKKAWCSKTFNCKTMNPLKYECLPNVICVAPNITQPKLCDDGFLRIQTVGEKDPTAIKSIVCNDGDGTWHRDSVNGLEIKKGTFVFCAAKTDPATGSLTFWLALTSSLVVLIGALIGTAVGIYIRRRRRYSPSEREMRKRPKKKGACCCVGLIPEKLIVEDLAILKEWTEDMFATILEQWLKFSVYERYKFAERIGFELGVSTNCGQFFTLFTRIFEIETDYRVWQTIVPVFKMLHAQAADKENNLDIDKRMRKWCISMCKPIIERVGWDGCNNEFRETAYVRYIVFNLMYYCEDKEFTEKLLEFFDKGGFHGLHSINRQVAWAAAIREKDKFDVAKKVAEEAFCDKNAKKEIEAKRAAAKQAASSGGWSKTKSNAASDVSGASSKSNKAAAGSAKDKKGVKGGSKETKSNSKDGSNKSNKSNRSNKSNKSKEEKKKGSKETPSGKAKKAEKSKEASKSDKSGKSGKDKKGGSKEAGKAKPRDKAGADEMKGDSGKEQKTAPASGSGKDKKKDKSGKDKKDKSNKSSKEKKSGKDKKTTSGKEKKTEDASGKEKTAEGSKSGKSAKDKKDGSKKSAKDLKTVTAIDKSSKSKKSVKSVKTTKSMKKKKRGAAIGYKERKDADGDKLHGDRAQHIFFAIGSSRSKEQIASFIDWYIESKEYDPSNLVYLFQATLEWDDTRSYGLDLFLNMNKEAFKKMPPGHKYHMRILKNFKRYVIGELDLQKLQSHIVNDCNYSAKNFSSIDISLMLKRIQNNVTFQPKMVEELDTALKKLNF